MLPKSTIQKMETNLHAMDYPMMVEREVQGAHIRFTDFIIKIPIRDFRTRHLNKMVSFEGIVRRVTSVRPKLKKSVYRCKYCLHEQTVEQNDLLRKEVIQCNHSICRKKDGMSFISEKSTYIDYQYIQVQEPPESVRTSYNTQSIDVLLEDDLTGLVNPGERVIVNGILEAFSKDTKKESKSVNYNKIIYGHSIEHIDKDFEEIEIKKEDEEKILQLSRDPEVYEKFQRSISPSIFDVGIIPEVKLALLLQLFSGVPKIMRDHSRIRGDIHILLVGDPGVAKSQLLRSMVELAPRGVYTTGKGSTASGLTATVVRDDLGEGRWVLEGGTLVMANHGLATIDEMDKMRDEDRGALHEAMEQQTISISKAGIIANLKTECSILGACNPSDGHYDKQKTLSSQIKMPNSLLSRFDIIFVILDQIDEENDILVAEHILNNHEMGERAYEEGFEENLLDIEFLRKYIAYARLHVHPRLTAEARERLSNFYTNVRKLRGEGMSTNIPITARYLEALIRLSEAHAKIRLSPTIEIRDVDRVIKLMTVSLKQVGIDPITGQMVLPEYQDNQTKLEHIKIRNIILEIINEENVFNYSSLVDTSKTFGIPESRVFNYVNNVLYVNYGALERLPSGKQFRVVKSLKDIK